MPTHSISAVHARLRSHLCGPTVPATPSRPSIGLVLRIVLLAVASYLCGSAPALGAAHPAGLVLATTADAGLALNPTCYTCRDFSPSPALPINGEGGTMYSSVALNPIDTIFADVQTTPGPAVEPAAVPPPRTEEEYRWRLRVDYSWTSPKLTPWVTFYRAQQEVPNQEVIRPERGPEELFVVGSFQAFKVEETSNNYRLALEHRLGRRLWAYGGIRHQRLVYRLDDDRTNYQGTEADLLFRGRIRYRELGLETGLNYRVGKIVNRISSEIRAGVVYHTERARVFDGTLGNRLLEDDLSFRYREELLPRYRWGYQAEMTTNYHLNDRMNLYMSFGLFGDSDGIVRLQHTLLGISRQF